MKEVLNLHLLNRPGHSILDMKKGKEIGLGVKLTKNLRGLAPLPAFPSANHE